MLAAIPSPTSDTIPVVGIRYYGVMIAIGVAVAVVVSQRRWRARGHDPDEVADVAVWAVPAGLLGARLYHVATDFNRYADAPWYWPLQIWRGGLGIPGGILGGILGGLLIAKRRGINTRDLADAMVPTIPLAQAIGRIGNYFNQELFGRPSELPWAIRIDPAHRPARYADMTTFHPTFAYEALWNLGVMGVLLWVDSKRILRPGKMLPAYVTAYFIGRLGVEYLRVDAANRVLGLRINTWVSLAMIGIGTAWLLRGGLFDRSTTADEAAVGAPTSG